MYVYGVSVPQALHWGRPFLSLIPLHLDPRDLEGVSGKARIDVRSVAKARKRRVFFVRAIVNKSKD